jgi:mRNA interferase MazF
MPTFESWDIVRVPFPYVERPVHQHRPALVLAGNQAADRYGLLWIAMITSAANRGWPGDVAISDLQEPGLPVPSVVRLAKLTTIEAHEADHLGTLPAADRDAVAIYLRDRLRSVLG